MPLILSDESLNRYKFRVLTSGITYIDNEIPMFDNHKHEQLPIGKFVNLQKVNGELLADPVYDEADDLAMKVKDKVDKGFIKGASIGFDVLEVSDAPALLLEGQTRPTVTKCLLLEGSPTAMRANIGARFLKYQGKVITLSGDDPNQLNDVLPVLSLKQETIKNKPMKILLSKLGLSEDATEQQAIEALSKIRSDQVEVIVTLGKNKGVINAENEAHYRKLATADADTTLALLNAMPVVEQQSVTPTPQPTPSEQHSVTLAALIREIKKDASTTNTPLEDFETLSKNNPQKLAKIRRDDPARYEKMAKAYVEKLKAR